MIVADTNLVAYLLIEGDQTAAARRVWERDRDWILPPLWRSEYLNVLATLVRTALRYGLSAYDAHFVVVAEQAGAALVTSDAAILQACPDLAVEPREFAAAT